MSPILDKKQMTEEDIKLNFITPSLTGKGWQDKITMETAVRFTDGKINLRGNIWVGISTDGEDVLEVSEGGHLYTPDVGGDSYTNWRWSIWSDGEESGQFMLDTNSVTEMIYAGAELSIELPEEYVYSEDD